MVVGLLLSTQVTDGSKKLLVVKICRLWSSITVVIFVYEPSMFKMQEGSFLAKTTYQDLALQHSHVSKLLPENACLHRQLTSHSLSCPVGKNKLRKWLVRGCDFMYNTLTVLDIWREMGSTGIVKLLLRAPFLTKCLKFGFVHKWS